MGTKCFMHFIRTGSLQCRGVYRQSLKERPVRESGLHCIGPSSPCFLAWLEPWGKTQLMEACHTAGRAAELHVMFITL